MEKTVIRRAAERDAPALARLRREWTLEDGPIASPREDFDAGFIQLVSDGIAAGRWVVWVAELDGEIVSHAFVGLVEKIPRPASRFDAMGYLTNVYTRPEFRGRGIGSLVLDAVTSWARSADLELLVVWPSETSIAHYVRHGFADRNQPLVWLHPETTD